MDPQPATSPDPNATPVTADLERAARLQVVLDEAREASLRFMLAIEAQVTQPDAPVVVEGDVTLAFHRAARAVRLTCLVQARLMAEAAAAAGGGAGQAPVHNRVTVRFVDSDGTPLPRDGASPEAPAAATPTPPRVDPGEVAGIVRQIAASSLLPGEFSPRDTRELVEGVEREARERLDRLDREGEFEGLLRRPTSEIVEILCRELGYAPEWTGLSRHAWALREVASGRVGEPLRPFSSPASGDREAEARSSQRGPRSGGGGADGADTEDAPSVAARMRRATSPARGGGEEQNPPDST